MVLYEAKAAEEDDTESTKVICAMLILIDRGVPKVFETVGRCIRVSNPISRALGADGSALGFAILR